MKTYPSIADSKKAPHLPCIAFSKYDGSNVRFEWQEKLGWHLYGTRHRIFDVTDSTFGCAINIFHEKFADQIERVLRNKYTGCKEATVYCEFLGPHSFAGQHDVHTLRGLGFDIESNEPKQLVLFDVNVYKKGFVEARKFVEDFGHLRIPEVVYEGNLDNVFIRDVQEGKYPVFEGVVCKGGSGHKTWMCKIKTFAYRDELKKRYQDQWSRYWE